MSSTSSSCSRPKIYCLLLSCYNIFISFIFHRKTLHQPSPDVLPFIFLKKKQQKRRRRKKTTKERKFILMSKHSQGIYCILLSYLYIIHPHSHTSPWPWARCGVCVRARCGEEGGDSQCQPATNQTKNEKKKKTRKSKQKERPTKNINGIIRRNTHWRSWWRFISRSFVRPLCFSR